MKVFARFWNFPNIGAGCRLGLTVVAGVLSGDGILRCSESNWVPVSTSIDCLRALEFSNDFPQLIHSTASFIPLPSMCRGLKMGASRAT